MPTLTLNLPTGYSATAKIRTQPRLGGSWSALVSPLSVVGTVYSFTVPSGDLRVQLTGVSEQDGDPFNVRDGIAYIDVPWSSIDVAVIHPILLNGYDCGPIVPAPPITTLGSGCCTVDHNYGGLLNLAYRASACLAIAGATVEVFDAVSWAAGNTAPSFALLSTVTIADGLWAASFMLNDGNYVLRFEKPGEFGPDIYHLTVNCSAAPATAFVPSPISPFGM